jgi:hypothetical protein
MDSRKPPQRLGSALLVVPWHRLEAVW